MDLLTELTAIGFTEYEAKVYLALLRENPATGYQISKKSGVPRSMVYETLSRLYARGAVLETVEDRATLYRPLPPDQLLDRYEAEHRRLLDRLRRGLNELFTAPVEEYVWALSGRASVLAYAGQMIARAKEEIYLVLPDDALTILRDGITAAWERGIDVSALLTGGQDLPVGRVARHPPLESEIQELIGTLLVVTDRREALIASTERETTATITRNANLVLIARQFVWMELFTQRIYERLGGELLERLDPEDREIFESLG